MRIDVDLQSWSALMSAVCDRKTPSDELSYVEMISDRLVLEKMEEIFGQMDQKDQAIAQGIIDKKLSEL